MVQQKDSKIESASSAGDAKSVIEKMRGLGSQRNIDGMNRFGITCKKKFGISSPELRLLARGHRRDHKLAQKLWKSGIHEAKILAVWVEDKKLVTEEQLDDWVQDIDCWAVCDTACGQLFDRTPFAYDKAFEWAKDEREFVRRAGIVLMATLAVHDKKASDSTFEKFFPVLKKYAADERNFVKKAVNWAIRQIGKRNRSLLPKAIKLAREIQNIGTPGARWIASGAIRELEARM